MSTEDVRRTVEEFVRRDVAEVLVIRGRWGVGKTYLWQDLVRTAAGSEDIGHSKYSYISLFGLESLADVKNAIFAETTNVDGRSEGREGILQRLQSGLESSRISGFRWLNWFREKSNNFDFEVLGNSVQGAGSLLQAVAYASVLGTLICIDDLERRGEGLRIRDVLGLVSQLKQERNCTICIILNEDALDDDDKEEFRTHGEKVFDLEVEFEPSAYEAVEIGIPDDHQYKETLRENCERFSIRNIRILQRIAKLSNRLAPLLKNREERTVTSVLTSLVILTWSYYDADDAAPDFEWTRDSKNGLGLYVHQRYSSDGVSEKESRWMQIISKCDHSPNPKTLQFIADFIEKGYYDSSSLRGLLDANDKSYQKGDKNSAYFDVWDELFHGSFEDNEAEFVGRLREATIDNISAINLNNINYTAKVLRQLGHDHIADQLVDKYVVYHTSDGRKLDYKDPFLSDEVTDDYLISKIDTAAESDEQAKSCADLLTEIGKELPLTREDEELLSRRSADEYYAFLEENSIPSKVRHRAITHCLKLREHSKDDTHYAIANQMEKTLQKLAQECDINRVRIEVIYGITADEKDEEQA